MQPILDMPTITILALLACAALAGLAMQGWSRARHWRKMAKDALAERNDARRDRDYYQVERDLVRATNRAPEPRRRLRYGDELPQEKRGA